MSKFFCWECKQEDPIHTSTCSRGVNFIVFHNVGDTKWYLCTLELNDDPTCDWTVTGAVSMHRDAALKFCKKKAENIAKILSERADETGYSNQDFVELF